MFPAIFCSVIFVLNYTRLMFSSALQTLDSAYPSPYNIIIIIIIIISVKIFIIIVFNIFITGFI